jgi:hypothetical protein
MDHFIGLLVCYNSQGFFGGETRVARPQSHGVQNTVRTIDACHYGYERIRSFQSVALWHTSGSSLGVIYFGILGIVEAFSVPLLFQRQHYITV